MLEMKFRRSRKKGKLRVQQETKCLPTYIHIKYKNIHAYVYACYYPTQLGIGENFLWWYDTTNICTCT